MGRVHGLIVAAALALAINPAFAYPDRPVTIVVPNPPGGTSDIVARVLAEKLTEELKQPFVIENRPGAGGTIGSQAVARAEPDGYTLLVTTTQHTINPFVLKNIGFEPIKSFSPVSLLVTVDTVLIANTSFAPNNIAELITLAKKDPGKLQYATPGHGTMAHLLSELLNLMAGIKIEHVPYKGVAPAVTDVLAGHVPMTFSSLPPAIALIKQGRVKPLGLSAATRGKMAPDIPAIAETIPGYKGDFWIGLFTTAGAPKEVVSKLQEAAVKALNRPDARAKLEGLGAQITTSSSADFTKLLEEDLTRWSKVVKDTGMKLE
jgi:tripartite-type tricarboxylate transporter receptor subunit TctC